MSSDLIKHVSDDSFEADVLRVEGPVLVNYWAEWSGPSKTLAPVLEEIAETYKGRLTVAKLSIDENQVTPERYGVRIVPALMLYEKGTVKAQKVGHLSKSELAAFLDAHV